MNGQPDFLDDEDQFTVDMLLKLSEFYREAMTETGISDEDIKKVTLRVALKQIEDIQNF
jgi:hypothetical protein